MPTIQGYDPQGGFGAQLGAALGGGVSQGLTQHLNRMFEEKKNRSALEGLSPFLEQLDIPKEGIEKLVASGVPAETVATLIPHLQKNQIAQKKEALKMEGTESSQQVYNEMVNLSKSGKLGKFHINRLNPSGVKERAKFDALRPKFFSAIRKLEQSGHITRETMAQIFKSIPNANDTDADRLGKLEALAETLHLDPSELYGLGTEEGSTQKEFESSSQIDTSKVFGKGKVKIVNPKTGEEFYAPDQKTLNEAKSKGWKVIGGS